MTTAAPGTARSREWPGPRGGISTFQDADWLLVSRYAETGKSASQITPVVRIRVAI